MKTRIFSMLLAVVLLFTSVDITAFAEEIKDENRVESVSEDEIETGDEEKTDLNEEFSEEDEENDLSNLETEENTTIEPSESDSTEMEEETTIEEPIEVESEKALETVSENTIVEPSQAVSISYEKMDGSGTEEDPYIIRNAEQLSMMRENLSASYELGGNIYLGVTDWVPIGDKTNPFSGYLNGKGYVIYGLNGFSIDYKYRGLFGYISKDGLVECLGVEMEGAHYVKANDFGVYIGMLVGELEGTVNNCYAKGRLRGFGETNDSGVIHGGILCGYLDKTGKIEGCYTEGSASVTGYGFVSMGYEGAGGICGNGSGGKITNCYSVCEVFVPGMGYARSYARAGGIIGGSYMETEIENCYAICDAGSSYQAKGICDRYPNTYNSSCYYVLTHNGKVDSWPSDPEKLKLASTFKGWDFENTWVMGTDGYPKLQYFQKNAQTGIELVASSPADNQTMVSENTDITLFFNKNIVMANDGLISFYGEDGGSISCKVDAIGRKVVINPLAKLEGAQKYFVKIQPEAIGVNDANGNVITNDEEYILSFSTYDESKVFTAGKYITFTENNGLRIPGDDISEYVEELKYWAEEYGYEEIVNCENLEEILQEEILLPAKIQQATEIKGVNEQICLVKLEDTSVWNNMRNILFIENTKTILEDTFAGFVNAKDYGDVVATYKVYEGYNEQIEKYYVSEQKESGNMFLALVATVFYQAANNYEGAKPYLKVSGFSTLYNDGLEDLLKVETYEEYKETNATAGKLISRGKSLYRAVVDGGPSLSTIVTFGSDMYSYVKDDSISSPWISEMKTFVKSYKSIKGLLDCALKFGLGGSAVLVFMIPDMIGEVWDSFDEKTRTWYFLSDFCIRDKYPNLYEFVYGEELYPTDKIFDINVIELSEYIALYGNSEQMKEIENIDKDPVLKWWCHFINNNIRAERKLRDEHLTVRIKINTVGQIDGKILNTDTNELKLATVECVSSLIKQSDSTTVMVSCPVTVNVFEKDTCELVASLSSDEIEYENDIPFLSTYVLGENNETKCVVLTSDNYYIEVEPYDTGEMDMSIDFGNGQGFCYENVSLTGDEPFFIEHLEPEYYELITEEESIVEAEEIIYGKEVRVTSDRTICIIGDTVQCGADIQPAFAEDTVIWSVDNLEIGTVDQDGTFHALKEGKIVITAMLASDNTILDTQEITVLSLTGDVTQYSASVQVAENEKVQLEIEGLTEWDIQNLEWYSDRPGIAQITSDGYVLGIGTGSATVTAEIGEIIINVAVEVAEQNYTLVFDYDYNEMVYEMAGLKYHQFVELPEEPNRYGYTIEGWYTEKNGEGEPFTSDSMVGGNMTLYAHWVEKDYGDVLIEDIPADGTIPEGLWLAGIDSSGYVYTGAAIRPSIRVYDGTTLLSAGREYTISYKNNVSVNDGSVIRTAPKITIEGKNNYSGTLTAYFTIIPKNIEDDDIEAKELVVQYNGKVQKKIPAVTWNGKKLRYNVDFTVEYPNLDAGGNVTEGAYREPGIYKIFVKGIGNYSGVRELALAVTDSKLISKAYVGKIADYKYTGEGIEPLITVKHNLKILEKGVDYEVSYKDNIQIGTASVIISGKGDYCGTKIVNFEIVGTPITQAVVSDVPSSLIYTGCAITTESEIWKNKPELIITVDGATKILEEDTDYEVSYRSNIDKGIGIITFVGKGAYSGELSRTFRILPYDFADDTLGQLLIVLDEEEFEYEKGGVKPKPIVMFGDLTLKEGKDYTLIYKNHYNVNDGTDENNLPTVVVKGKGNFSGVIERTFTIKTGNIEELEMAVCDKVFTDNAGLFQSEPIITTESGKKLKKGVDYQDTITYCYKEDTILEGGTLREAGSLVEETDIVPEGTTLKVIAVGKGNYEGIIKGEYRVVKYDISKASVTIPKKDYTGDEVTLSKGEIRIKIGNKTLTTEDFEIVSYSDNVDRGRAKVTIRGLGDYGGTKTVRFTIKSKLLEWWEGVLEKLFG